MGGSTGDETLNAPMTVVGMVNGMIGGLILILPVLALNAGYILTFIVILVTGVFSYYSCYLCVIHMGDQPDLDYAILRHFNGNRGIKIFYDLCVWSNLILIDMLYFELIVIQWQGLVLSQSIVIPLVNAIVLFLLVFVLKFFEFGASVMAYGIISIITYLIFLIWVISTSDQGYSDVPYNAFGTGAVGMAAAMGQAFSIQSFFIPVLKKNQKPQKYVFYTFLAYLLGSFAYYYIAYLGSFGIWHRKYIGSTDQITIEGYFRPGAWEVNIIQAIYLIHLYSVFPEFMLISKKRLFGVFRIQQSHKGKVSIPQIVYIAIAVGICLIITLLNVSINDIIDINGAVIGFFFIYFLPAILHIKCMYFSKGKMPIPRIQFKIQSENSDTIPNENLSIPRKSSEIEIQAKMSINLSQTPRLTEPLINNSGQQTQKVVQEENKKGGEQWKFSQGTVPRRNSKQLLQLSNEQAQNSFYYCDCNHKEASTLQKVGDITLMSIMVIMGAFIMVNGIIQVARS